MVKRTSAVETARHPGAARASKTLKNITENPQPQEGLIQVVPASALRAEIAKATADEARKMFTIEATIRPMRPIIRNVPMPERFFLVV